MSVNARVGAALAAKKARTKPASMIPRPAAGSPPGVGTVPGKENPLMAIARDMAARMPGGRDSLLALKAIKDWRSSRALQVRYSSVADYHDILVELAEAKVIRLEGKHFMATEKIVGIQYGLKKHERWIAAGRPGTFTAFVESERTRESEEV